MNNEKSTVAKTIPGTDIQIIDNSFVFKKDAGPYAGLTFLMPTGSQKGPEKLTVVDNVDEFRKMFLEGGKFPYNKFGNPLYAIDEILTSGSRVIVKRIVAEDATIGNTTLVAEISKLEKQKVDKEGNLLYIDPNGNETVEPSTTIPNPNYDPNAQPPTPGAPQVVPPSGDEATTGGYTGGTTLKVKMNMDLNPVNNIDGFSISKITTNRNATPITVTNAKITAKDPKVVVLTLSRELTTQDGSYRVSYVPGTVAITAVDTGISLGLIADFAIITAPKDTVAPIILPNSATYDNATSIRIEANEKLATVSNVGGFVVSDGSNVTINATGAVESDDNKFITLTLDRAIDVTGTYTISYAKTGRFAIEDLSGNALENGASLDSFTVNIRDLVNPTVTNVTYDNETEITLTLSEECNKGSFSGVSIDKSVTVVSSIIDEADLTKVKVTIQKRITKDGKYTISYNGNNIMDLAGNKLLATAKLGEFTYAKTGVTPTFTSVDTNGVATNITKVFVTCSEAVTLENSETVDGFSITANKGTVVGITSVKSKADDNTKLEITLATALNEEDTYTVAYTKGNTNIINGDKNPIDTNLSIGTFEINVVPTATASKFYVNNNLLEITMSEDLVATTSNINGITLTPATQSSGTITLANVRVVDSRKIYATPSAPISATEVYTMASNDKLKGTDGDLANITIVSATQETENSTLAPTIMKVIVDGVNKTFVHITVDKELTPMTAIGYKIVKDATEITLTEVKVTADAKTKIVATMTSDEFNKITDGSGYKLVKNPDETTLIATTDSVVANLTFTLDVTPPSVGEMSGQVYDTVTRIGNIVLTEEIDTIDVQATGTYKLQLTTETTTEVNLEKVLSTGTNIQYTVVEADKDKVVDGSWKLLAIDPTNTIKDRNGNVINITFTLTKDTVVSTFRSGRRARSTFEDIVNNWDEFITIVHLPSTISTARIKYDLKYVSDAKSITDVMEKAASLYKGPEEDDSPIEEEEIETGFKDTVLTNGDTVIEEDDNLIIEAITYTFPLFTITAAGRGVSNLKVKISPQFDMSKYSQFLYRLDVLEANNIIETKDFLFNPFVSFRDKDKSIETELQDSQIVKAKIYEDYYDEFFIVLEEFTGLDAEKLTYDLSLLDGKDKLTKLPSELVSVTGVNVYHTYGISLSGGSDGEFAKTRGKLMDNTHFVEQLEKFYRGKLDEDIWSTTEYVYNFIIDCAYPNSVKRAMEYLVDHTIDGTRRDVVALLDMGDQFTTLSEFERERYIYGNGNTCAIYPQNGYIRNKFDRRKIKVTLPMLIATKLKAHYATNNRSKSLCGMNSVFVFPELLDINFIPKHTPELDQRKSFEQLSLNYGLMRDGKFTLEESWSAQEPTSSLSYINNMIAIQQVVQALQAEAAKSRYGQLSGQELADLTKKFTSVCERYRTSFQTIEFGYDGTPETELRRTYVGRIKVVCHNTQVAEEFKINVDLPEGV